MNTQKIIKYILIAIPALFLAKCGIEAVVYNADLTPKINPNPTHKMKVYGNFPFEKDVNMKIAILYITTNPKCDNVNWLAGIRSAQIFMKPFPTTVKNENFESMVYLDNYLPGACQWRAHNIFVLMEGKKDNLDVVWSSQGLTDEQSEEKISAAKTRVGTIGYESFSDQGKTLHVECTKEKKIRWKGLPKEKSLTELQCLGKEDHHDSRSILNLISDVSSSQKEVEINFINKGFQEWKK